MQSISTIAAIECFMQGFAGTRRYSRPCDVQQLEERIWMVSDPPENRKPPRTSEVIVYRIQPGEISEAIRKHKVTRHFVSSFVDDASEMPENIATIKSIGYRLLRREPFFVVSTAEAVRFEAAEVRRVCTLADANEIAKVARARQIPEQYLTAGDAPTRLYASYHQDQPVGWVRGIRTSPQCSYVSNLYVKAEHRRKGIGRSLMSALLLDDHRYGIEWSVLLASQAGALLYPHLGYKQIGYLLLFSQKR